MQNHTDRRPWPAIMKGLATSALACALLVAGAPSAAFAQQSTNLDARWQAWIGCWQPANTQALTTTPATETQTPLVCITPATSSGVNMTTVADGKVVGTTHLDATGKDQQASTKDGCTGVESAEWSADGHRLYTRSNYTCSGGLTRTSTGVLAMSPPNGDWVSVQGVTTDGVTGVRTLHYTDVGTPSNIPSEIADALHGRSLAQRAAAAAPLTTANVVEASHKVDSAVVEAWLIDRGQKFDVDANKLVALADAGVPSNVTDAMVALSYPKSFTVASANGGAGDVSLAEGVDNAYNSAYSGGVAPGHRIHVYMEPYSPYGYSLYGFSPYGNYYSPYSGFYSPYALGAAFGGWYAPIVIIRNGDENPTGPVHGTVVRGRGYTQGSAASGSTGGTAHPRPSVMTPRGAMQPGSDNDRTTRSAPPPPPPAPAPTRTAKPRNP